MLNKIIAAFTTTANSFKNKSKLTEFYKAIHPDMLQNAPDNVKLENTRSLKILNNYFDAVSQNERTEPQELTFYMADKQNTKARNFLPFTIILDAYLGKDQQIAIDKVTNQIKEQINQKYQEIRKDYFEKQANNPFIAYPNNYEKVKQDFLQTTTSVKKRSTEQEAEQVSLRASIFSVQMRTQYDDMLKQASSQMRQANMPQIKPRLWANLMLEKSDIVPNLYNIFEQLIDPRLIYFDQNLTQQQCDIFIQKLAPTTQNLLKIEQMAPFFKRLENNNPQIYLYVTNHYGASDIPGFYSIPYNFEIQEIQEKFGQFQNKIKKEKQEYDKELKKFNQSIYNIQQKYMIINIQNEVQLKNVEILKKINLSLLVLQKQLEEVDIKRLNNLRQKQWIFSDNVDRTVDRIDHFYIPIPFSGVV